MTVLLPIRVLMVPVVPIGGGGRGGIRGDKVRGCEKGGGGFVCECFFRGHGTIWRP